MTIEATAVILFCVATGVAMVVRRLRIPYTVALVLVGLALGALHLVAAPHLTKTLLFALFLPGLVFDAAYNLDAGAFRQNARAITALALPGVLVGIVLTGAMTTGAIGALGLAPGFGWREGLVFGALVAATDPIAVVALFRSLNAPARLRVLIEGESLLNDGTSIVLLTLILAFATGATTSGVDLLAQFLTVVGGGALLGGIVGVLASRVIARIDDAMIEITLTTIAAYGSFVLGEQFGYSGVISTVTAGMICGNYGRRIGMSPSTQLAVQSFWEYVAFALNSLIFLLIGVEVGLLPLASHAALVAVAILAVLLGRAVVVFGTTLLLRRTTERIPLRWSVVLTWGGLRGALSMVLALALAPEVPQRALLVTMTFGVVVGSILLQGVSMPVLLRRLGMVEAGAGRLEYDLARGRLQGAVAVLEEIERMRARHAAPPELLDRMADRYARARDGARETLMALHLERQELGAEAVAAALEHLLLVEKGELSDRLRSGYLRQEAYDRLAADVDARLVRVREGAVADPAGDRGDAAD